MNSIPKIPRRIVTGLKAGKSTIIQDGLVENISEHIPGLIISDVWATNTMPVNLGKDVQLENTLFPFTQKNGSYFRYVCIPPDTEIMPHFESVKMQSDNSHPLMHKTETLDYIIILSGEIYLILEEKETLLRAGDIVIQRATNHAWSNRSDSPCIQLAILLDAKES